MSSSIIQTCRDLGFAVAGVTRAEPTRHAAELTAWLAAGRHGEMSYLADTEDVLLDPRRLLEGARSVICVGDRYHDGTPDRSRADAAPRGRVARYARGDDYHRVMKKRLHELCDALADRFPDARFRACVDTAPLLEREYAERAGLGAVGKHTLVIERGVGSYILLGEILTTLDLEPSSPAEPDPCGTCTRCIDACPTDAITPWSVDATRCISYLTIEHRSRIDPTYHAPMQDWLFGCDVCQEVCPHNQPSSRSSDAELHPAYAPRRDGFDLLEVLGWTASDRREAFARSSMKRARLAMMRRNALIVAGNVLGRTTDPALRTRVETIAGDETEDELVRATARAVVERLDQA